MITYFKMQSSTLHVGPPVYFVLNNPSYPYEEREWQNKICGGAGCDKDSLTQIAYNAYRRPEQLVYTSVVYIIIQIANCT